MPDLTSLLPSCKLDSSMQLRRNLTSLPVGAGALIP